MSTPLPTFQRHKTLPELRHAVKAEGWMLNEVLFNKGDDCVSFEFQIGRGKGLCVFNTVNGKICGEFGKEKKIFTSQTTEHDNCPWFQKLLNVCLVAEPAVKAAKPFGFDVEVEVYIGVIATRIVSKHWRADRESRVRNKAMLIKNAKRVVKVTPLTEAQWIAAYGDPRMKAES